MGLMPERTEKLICKNFPLTFSDRHGFGFSKDLLSLLQDCLLFFRLGWFSLLFATCWCSDLIFPLCVKHFGARIFHLHCAIFTHLHGICCIFGLESLACKYLVPVIFHVAGCF